MMITGYTGYTGYTTTIDASKEMYKRTQRQAKSIGKILIVKDINHKTEEFINEVQKTHKKHDELRNEVLNSELSDEFKTNFQKLIDSKNDVKS